MNTPSPYRHADPLGNPLEEHHVAGAQQVIRFGLGLFCILVAVDCVWLGMWPRFGDVPWEAVLVTGAIALVFLWLAWGSFSRFATARKQQITRHEFGLRIHNAAQHQDVRFDDIAAVGGMLWQTPGQAPPAGAVLWIDDVQGRRIELPSPHARAHELGKAIREITFARRKSSIESKFEQGETVSFGRVVLDRFALILDGHVISRESIKNAEISDRYVRFVGAGDGHRISTEIVPNADVLVALLRKE